MAVAGATVYVDSPPLGVPAVACEGVGAKIEGEAEDEDVTAPPE